MLFIVAGSLVFQYVASSQARKTLETERTEKLSDISARLPLDFDTRLDAVIRQYEDLPQKTVTAKALQGYIDFFLPDSVAALAADKAGSYESSSFGVVSLDSSPPDGKAVIGKSSSYKNSWYPRLLSLSLIFPSDTKWQISPYKSPWKDGPEIQPWISTELDNTGKLKTNKNGWKPPIALAYAAQSYERIDSDLMAIERSIGTLVWITLLLGIFFAVVLGVSISSRLVRVKRGIAGLATDLSKPVPRVSGELGEIAVAANNLALDLLKSKSRSERVLDQVSTGIVVVGPDMRIIQANPSSLVIAEKTKGEILGFDVSSIGEIGEMAKPEIVRATKTGSVWNSGAVKLGSATNQKFVSMRVVPVKLGQSGEAILAMQDVTDSILRTMESEREASLARLGLFTMGVAHEVRNPLTSIKGFVQLLDRKLKGRDEARYLTPVMREVDRLESMITDLLESSRPGPIRKKSIDLSEFVEEVLASQASKLIEFGVKIQRSYKVGIPAWIDEKRLHQVLLNLIINAKEAMPDGGTLTLSTSFDESWDIIEVADTGHGIGEEDAAKIFTPFYTTKASGTGLGLSICDQIIKSHGGTISFVSDERGTIFTVKLPKGAQPMEENHE